MFCERCGYQNADGVNFCQRCGAPLKSGEPGSRQSVPPRPVKAVELEQTGRDVLKNAAGSVLFLSICCCMSAQILLRLIAVFSASSRLASVIHQVLTLAGMSEYRYYISSYLENISSASVALSLVGCIPALVGLGGLWTIYAAGKNRDPQKMSSVGFTIHKVLIILEMVGYVFSVVVAECGLIYLLVSLTSGDYNLYVPKSVVIVIAVFIFLILVALVLKALYYSKVLGALNIAKRIAFYGEAEELPVVYVAVFCFIGAFGTLLSGFTSGVFGILSGICGSAALVILGICMLNVSARLRAVMNGSMAIPANPTGVILPPDGHYKPDTTVLSNYISQDTMVLSVSPVADVDQPVQPRATLIRQKDGMTIEVKGALFRMGKGAGQVDYFISDNTAVSRHHADIIFRDDRYFIRDNNSTNHVYLNEQMIPADQEIPLESGSRILLADDGYLFTIEG